MNQRRLYLLILALGSLVPITGCAENHRHADTPRAPHSAHSQSRVAKPMTFEATAYSVKGKTDGGIHTRDGIVAADPKVLPFGTRIRISGAGKYDGEYLVADSGRTIKGRELDIFIANGKEATRFGRKKVRVEILERGDGTAAK